MPKKIYALYPEAQEQECDHPMGFPYRGAIPCTGPQICPLCGTNILDVEKADDPVSV